MSCTFLIVGTGNATIADCNALFKRLVILAYLLQKLGVILSDREFSLYDIEQFIREAGAEKVTEDAVLDLERQLEKLANNITDNALRYATHAGRRKLIRKADIMLTGGAATARAISQYHYAGARRRYSNARNLRRNARITKSASIIER